MVTGTVYPIGALHATDGLLQLDTINVNPAVAYSPAGLAGHHLSAKNLGAFRTPFARDAKPAAPGQPAWLPYDTTDRATMMGAALVFLGREARSRDPTRRGADRRV